MHLAFVMLGFSSTISDPDSSQVLCFSSLSRCAILFPSPPFPRLCSLLCLLPSFSASILLPSGPCNRLKPACYFSILMCLPLPYIKPQNSQPQTWEEFKSFWYDLASVSVYICKSCHVLPFCFMQQRYARDCAWWRGKGAVHTSRGQKGEADLERKVLSSSHTLVLCPQISS